MKGSNLGYFKRFTAVDGRSVWVNIEGISLAGQSMRASRLLEAK
jgi:hypothetical protein